MLVAIPKLANRCANKYEEVKKGQLVILPTNLFLTLVIKVLLRDVDAVCSVANGIAVRLCHNILCLFLGLGYTTRIFSIYKTKTTKKG
ncbi:hypothetical protein COI97_18930 [Bacillus cereus]|nr:hypothetical protein COI97_18930 [Bacillus cereus]